MRFPVPPSCSAERCDIYNDGVSGTGCRAGTSQSIASDPEGQKEDENEQKSLIVQLGCFIVRDYSSAGSLCLSVL